MDVNICIPYLNLPLQLSHILHSHFQDLILFQLQVMYDTYNKATGKVPSMIACTHMMKKQTSRGISHFKAMW
jgi:hypothetical protein